MPEPVSVSNEAIATAAGLLRDGHCVAFPTETVYGLGADATNPDAVAAIYEAKGRPHFNPLIIHVATIEAARKLVQFSETAELLAQFFWPGALTLVLPRKDDCPVCLLAGAGLDSLAVRIPAPETARALLTAAGVPIAAPSANPSGAVSPTTASHVAEGLGEKVAMILDDGPCATGIESTIIDLTGPTPTILRPGGVTAEGIEAVIGKITDATGHSSDDAPRAPGQLSSHYATTIPLRMEVTMPEASEALLAFGPDLPETNGPALNLSPTGDLREAAANLFAMMRALDQSGCSAIAVMPIPDHGLGHAINDRLRRASHR